MAEKDKTFWQRDYNMNVLEIISELRKKNVFPTLAEDNLKLIGETKLLSKEFIEQIKHSKNDIIDFLRGPAEKSFSEPILSVTKQEAYKVSNGQNRIWTLSQFEGGTEAYNIVTSLILEGTVIIENLTKAFKQSIQRHESLRTVFRIMNGEPHQVILDQVDFTIDFHDISETNNVRSFLISQVEESAKWAFDLEDGPLIKVNLFRIGTRKYAMIFGVHHIISDGWSINVLIQEVLGSYALFCQNKSIPIVPLRIHYKDYSAWLLSQIEGEKAEDARNFWKQQLEGRLDILNLPYDFVRPEIRSYEGAVSKFYFNNELYRDILAFCQINHVTIFNFFRSVLTILLNKISGQTAITIGTPVSGRNHYDLENQIGLYTNTLPLQAEIETEVAFLPFLNIISENSYKAFQFQHYPLDKIIDDLSLKRDPGRSPLFDVMIVLQDTAIGSRNFNANQKCGFDLDFLDSYLYDSAKGKVENRPAKCDLTFNFDSEAGGKHFLELEYSTQLFKRETTTLIYDFFLNLIEQVLHNPLEKISSLQILSENEREKLLTELNRPIEEIKEQNILELLHGSFQINKKQTAIISGEKKLSYEQLDQYSDDVSEKLRRLNIAESSSTIGLLLGRTEWMIITILGILKAGMSYVPIDVLYPSERINYILDDSQVSHVVVDEIGLTSLPTDFEGDIIHISSFIQEGEYKASSVILEKDQREQLAYLIYTSGSTGRPKGVKISHKNVIAFLKWALKEFRDTRFDVIYATTSYCFDLSVFEFLFPLCQGKTIRLLGSANQIPEFIQLDRNILINTVPSVVRNLLDVNMSWVNVTALNIAGEPLLASMKKDLSFVKAEIRNLYGPTEDTTYSTVYKFDETEYPNVPIGKPIDFSHLYILDPDQHLLPIGIAGEIYLGGEGVAMGYLNQPGLTSEKFVKNPFIPGTRMYRTGDMGKWLADGNIVFLGRKDDQVKIRGNRIELGEIQYIIEQFSGIKQAIISVDIKEGENQIVAYCLGQEQINLSLLKEYLAGRLPSYMIPAYFIELDEVPLNSNGKIDKSKLPRPMTTQTSYSLKPQNELQWQLLNLWEEVLEQKGFGIEDVFFDLGGHSLKATKLKYLINSRLSREITLNEIFAHPTVEKQAVLIAEKLANNLVHIPNAIKSDNYPISFTQERLWVLTNFGEASVAYHMPAAFDVEGDLNLDTLEKAFILVIGQHEILRTVFTEADNKLIQVIIPEDEFQFSIEEVVLKERLSQQDLNSFLKKKWNVPFNLRKGPLLKVFCVRASDSMTLSFNMHHIISDGWSLGVLYNDVINAYNRLCINSDIRLPDLDFQYKDFAVWQRSALREAILKKDLSFWKERFTDNIPVLELSTDYHRPEIKTYIGCSYNYQFDSTFSQKINELSKKSGATLFMTLMAGVNVLLKKYSNQDQIVIGTPVAGREYQQLENQIGLFVNTLPISTTINGESTFLSFLSQQKEIILECFEHQGFPFEMLIDELSPKRDLSRSPLFDVMLVLQNIGDLDGGRKLTGDVVFNRIDIQPDIAKYDCTFSFVERDSGLILNLEYNTDLFKESTIEQMTRHLFKIFSEVFENPEIKIKEINLLSHEEQKLLSSRTDRTDVGYQKSSTLISFFQAAVSNYPNNIAIIVGDKHITYAELDLKSSQLSRVLIQEYGVLSEDLICLHFERSEWMIIAILAVLKSGAAYIPIDPNYPMVRINYIIEDSRSSLILFDIEPDRLIKEEWSTKKFINVLDVDYSGEGMIAEIKEKNLAYVIYTSGTTGNPKGVLIEHINVCRLLFNDDKAYDFDAKDRWPLFHSYCFDVSVWEMYGSLLNGGALIIVPKEITQNSIRFYDFLVENRITVLNQTPTAFRSLTHNNQSRFMKEPLDTIRFLIFAGEALLPGVLKEWHEAMPSCRIINMYGITETTVHVTFREITSLEIIENKSVIGYPLPTLSCYILDGDLQQVPINVIGELCVGGLGLARGYLNRPDLTAEKFIKHPGKADERLYRSGDYARILPSGDIEYIGRKDDQVKIRGHRIEISEIETVIIQQYGIKDAVVLPLKNISGDYEIIAYYIKEENAETLDLRSVLSQYLPAYMVPSYLIPLTSFPLNRNGKLDKTALPKPELAFERNTSYTAPRNELDERIVEIWESVLEIKSIGITENFFDLGGHSLKATRVIAKIHEIYKVKIDLKDLFIDPTIQHLSNYVETALWIENQNGVVSGNEDEIIF